MDKPSLVFFETLGQYVYAYIDPKTSEWYYVGKANNARCWDHVIEKGFDPEHCHIVAKNLENFAEKDDWQSFLLESYLITNLNPKKNTQSGHYKECFEMATLSSMFSDFQAAQHDNFESFPDWYIENYESMKGKVREIIIRSNLHNFSSNANNGIYCNLQWVPSDQEARIILDIATNIQGERVKETTDKLEQWLIANDHRDYELTTPRKITVDVSSTDDAVYLFSEFCS